MIKEWLDSYNPKNKDDVTQALREIMQEIALGGLQRAGFFEKAAFYGGTALRIFHKLDRFSEDLDFSLLEVNPDFALDKYLNAVRGEFASLGMDVRIAEKKKTNKTPIESAFLKSETMIRELVLNDTLQQILNKKVYVKIKLEIDTKPPIGFKTEENLLLKPFSFYVKCFRLPYLFSGKMHALLFRKWKENVKGRDWYDFEWYVKNNIPLNLEHFVIRSRNSGDLPPKEEITQAGFRELLSARIDAVDMKLVKDDITRFISDPAKLKLWSPGYFHDLAKGVVIQ